MDPVALSAAATSLVVALLNKAAEAGGQQLGEAAVSKIKDIWSAVTARFRGQALAEAVGRQLETQPDNENYQQMFRIQLKEYFEKDPDFRKQVENLVTAARASSDAGEQILNLGSGAIATNSGVAGGEGSVVIGRDAHGGVSVGRENAKPETQDQRSERGNHIG